MGAALARSARSRRSDEGRFADEIVPVGELAADEGPRRDTTLEKLAALPPVFDPEGTTTAGNAPGVNDGAGALVVTQRGVRAQRGLEVLATIVAQGYVADEFAYLARTPAGAGNVALQKAGKTIGDVKRVEVNEAFCSVALNSVQHARRRPGDGERERRRGRARAPDRRVRRAHPLDDDLRAPPPGRRARPRRDLLRRRPGRRAARSRSRRGTRATSRASSSGVRQPTTWSASSITARRAPGIPARGRRRSALMPGTSVRAGDHERRHADLAEPAGGRRIGPGAGIVAVRPLGVLDVIARSSGSTPSGAQISRSKSARAAKSPAASASSQPRARASGDVELEAVAGHRGRDRDERGRRARDA